MPASPQPRNSRSSSTRVRKFPGAFDGETVWRRRFMTGTAHTAGAIAAAAVTPPALGFAIGDRAVAVPGTLFDTAGASGRQAVGLSALRGLSTMCYSR